jgi:acetyltransferase-like isoleucine patch superfamily enzyme
MLSSLADFLLKKIGKKDYILDPAIHSKDLFIILFEKSIQLLRGCWLRLFLRSSRGIILVGRRTKIRFKTHIHVGKSVFIGDNVEINALCKQGVRIGDHVSIHRNTIIECTGVIRNLGEGIIIGNNVGIAQNCFIQVRGNVIIGNDVIIAPGVSIFSENHIYSDPDRPIREQGEVRIGVIIEDGAWIGSGVTILDGVKIGRNSVLASGSLVNKDVPEYTIVAGVPARIVKTILSKET